MHPYEASTERRQIEEGNVGSESHLVRAVLGSLSRNFNPTNYGSPPIDQSGFFYDHVADEKEFGGLIPFLIRTIRFFFIITLWALSGSCSHLLFYKWTMPREVAAQAFSLDYGFYNNHERVIPGTEVVTVNHQSDKYRVFRDRTCASHPSAPFATIDLFAKQNSWEAFHADVVPSPKSKTRLLQSKQSYYVDVALELPESKANFETGIFGLVIDLSSSTNQTLLAASRSSARLPHESAWVSVVRKFLLLPALLFGALEESRTIYLTPFRHFVESVEFPLQYVTILVVAKSDDHVIEITKGFIRIGEEMDSLQELMKEWYYTCFFIGTMIFMGVNFGCWNVVYSLYGFLGDRIFTNQEPPCDLNLDDDDFLDGDPAANDDPDNIASAFEDYAPQNTESNQEGQSVGEDASSAFGGQEQYTFATGRSAAQPASRVQREEGFGTSVDQVDDTTMGSWEDM
mmetsp:Transcript_8430/g.11082  ORF Transcript_8430/g.11082 Transcript_8430/m.11082 type:complete len:457 (-) Transcript_8430:391-1761(-)